MLSVNCYAGRKVGSIALFLRKMQVKVLVDEHAGSVIVSSENALSVLKWTCSSSESRLSHNNYGIAVLKLSASRQFENDGFVKMETYGMRFEP